MSSLAPLSPAASISESNRTARAASGLRDYAQLFKARVTAMIVMTSWCGAALASKPETTIFASTVTQALIGIAMVAAGSAAMNEVIERGTDAKMRRTAMRPLVSGRISTPYATAISVIMIAGGTAYLGLTTNWTTAFLAFLTSASYLGVYTPLKRVSPICTTLGAIPGAMPAVLGWTAVRGEIDLPAILLFGILFFWQFPHFFAIALLYRQDYECAGIRMLPVVEPSGVSTVHSILVNALLLSGASFLPAVFGIAGTSYLLIALLLDSAILLFSVLLWRDHVLKRSNSKRAAQKLLAATIFYLPALFAALVVLGLNSGQMR